MTAPADDAVNPIAASPEGDASGEAAARAGVAGVSDPPMRVIMLAIVLALTACGVYWPNLSGAFVYDDEPGITGNTSIRSLFDLQSIMSPPLETPVAGRPFTNLSLAIDYAIWQHEPFGYKLHNLVLHILAAWLLLGILRRTFDSQPMRARFDVSPAVLAFALVLLWVVHPLYGEVVVYAIQRTEALASVMMLAVFYAAIRGWSSQRTWPWLALAAVAHFIGLGSKEIVVTTLPLLLLYDRAFVSGSFRQALSAHRWWYISLACTLLLLVYTYRDNPRAASTGLSHGVGMFDYLFTQSNVLMYYIKSVLWPGRLYIINDWPIARHWLLAVPAGPVVLLLLGLTFYCVWRYPRAGFIGCWFFFILAPSSSIIPIPTEVASDRRMYLPSLAVLAIAVLVLVWLIQLALRRSKDRRSQVTTALLVVTIPAAAALAIRNVQHLAAFESEMTFWQTAIRVDPGSKWALEGYAIELARDRQYVAALRFGRAAALQMPHAPGITTFLANVHYVLGDVEAAEYMHRRAYRLAPHHRDAPRRLASFLKMIGKTDEAIALLQERMPDHPRPAAYNLLGECFIEVQRYEDAVTAFETSRSLEPYRVDTLVQLGYAYNLTGRYTDAIAPLEAAVRFDPQHVNAHYQLAAAYAETDNLPAAAAQFRRVLELEPSHPHAARNLAEVKNSLRMGPD